ncbi:hypothetical protein SISSUDRAFT_1054297 [Sistotremastrum suecicum HHB10207 ss-3]|uniref:Uncharacterized protein n=1 Tax=Sistotremastrum suecicum HHB10207 ss-3 TaxID=1314776 RepID=A0A165YLV0_9AGAM|nr:hypothetical protein SISSUDRAFT_1054297 [Sistotremastrum suecicum HHB10207 ss-3]
MSATPATSMNNTFPISPTLGDTLLTFAFVGLLATAYILHRCYKRFRRGGRNHAITHYHARGNIHDTRPTPFFAVNLQYRSGSMPVEENTLNDGEADDQILGHAPDLSGIV